MWNNLLSCKYTEKRNNCTHNNPGETYHLLAIFALQIYKARNGSYLRLHLLYFIYTRTTIFIHPEVLLGAFVRILKFLHINWSRSAVVLFYFLINTCIIMIAIKLHSYSSLGFVARFTLYHMILLSQSWIRSELDIPVCIKMEQVSWTYSISLFNLLFFMNSFIYWLIKKWYYVIACIIIFYFLNEGNATISVAVWMQLIRTALLVTITRILICLSGVPDFAAWKAF